MEWCCRIMDLLHHTLHIKMNKRKYKGKGYYRSSRPYPIKWRSRQELFYNPWITQNPKIYSDKEPTLFVKLPVIWCISAYKPPYKQYHRLNYSSIAPKCNMQVLISWCPFLTFKHHHYHRCRSDTQCPFLLFFYYFYFFVFF